MSHKRTSWPICLLSALAGCQTYHPQPIDLPEYAQAWAERQIDIEPVREFAERLFADDLQGVVFDASDGLSLGEAEAVALYFNPRLRLARAEAEVPLASAKEAGWWPDPQFQAEILRFTDRGRNDHFRFDGASLDGVNTGILNGSGLEATPPGYRRVDGDFVDDPWEVGASLSFTIPVSGRLAVEQELRWSEYTSAWRRIVVAEWNALTRFRAVWLEWSTAERRLAVTRDYIQRLEAVQGIAAQLAAAGEMRPTDARVLQIEQARQRNIMWTLEINAAEKRLQLFSMMGIDPQAPIKLEPSIPIATIDVAPGQRREQLLQRHPRIKAVEADYEAAEQQLRLEIRKQYPDLQLGPSYLWEDGFSRLGLGVGFDLPLWNRNRQAIAEASAGRDAMRRRAQTELEILLSELAQVETRLRLAARQREFLLQQVAPLVDRQVTDAQTLLDLGEVNVLLLRDALTSSLEARLDLLDAGLSEAQAANELEQMLKPRWVTPSQTKPEENKS